MSDIVERLRVIGGQMYVNELRSTAADADIYRSWKAGVCDAADEIERSRAEVADLKRLSGELADMLEAVDSHASDVA